MLRWSSTRLGSILLSSVAFVALFGLGLFFFTRQTTPYEPSAPFRLIKQIGDFTERGVHVTVALERDHNGTAILASTYSPLAPTGHVYSKDLPREGIEGAGRPTLIEVVDQPGVQVIGPLVADRPVLFHTFEGFSAPFPLYPDGPVTLRLPLALTNVEATTELDLAITYMSCSSEGYCLPPVIAKQLAVALPDMR